MKTLNRISILGLLAALSVFAQGTTLTQTTTAAAMTAGARTISLTSATGISAPSYAAGTVGTQLYVVDIGQVKGEVMNVESISGTIATVKRFSGPAVAHASGAMVLAGTPNNFWKYNPTGSCTRASTQVTPWVNTLTGEQWLCSTITGTWTSGFQNPAPGQAGTLVASAAGATAVNAPIQHINGTNAITAFTMGIGWNGGPFCIIPDAAFTTTATNNIAKASTAVANKTLCYQFDATNSLFTPSY